MNKLHLKYFKLEDVEQIHIVGSFCIQLLLM